MAIKSFDRATCRLLSADIDAALKTVADKHGIVLKTGPGRFSSQNFSFKVDASIIVNGTAKTPTVTEFEQYAELLGLKATDLGRSFMFRGAPYTICGAKMSSRKYPILAKNRNGKVYKFQASDVKRFLTGATTTASPGVDFSDDDDNDEPDFPSDLED